MRSHGKQRALNDVGGELADHVADGLNHLGEHGYSILPEADGGNDLVVHVHFGIGTGRADGEFSPFCAVLQGHLKKVVGVDDLAVGDRDVVGDYALRRSNGDTRQNAMFVLVCEVYEDAQNVTFGQCLNWQVEKRHLFKLREVVCSVWLDRLNVRRVCGMDVGDVESVELSCSRVDRELSSGLRLAGQSLLAEIPARQFPSDVVQRAPEVLYAVGRHERPDDWEAWDALERYLDGARIRVELLREANRVGVVGRGDLGFKFLQMAVRVGDLRIRAI